MKTYVYTLELKEGKEIAEAYRDYHKKVWTEVEESLRSVGVLGMKIYLLGRRLVNIVETTDEFEPETGFARYAENNPVVQEWERLMKGYQKRVGEAAEGEWWALMDKVYELR